MNLSTFGGVDPIKQILQRIAADQFVGTQAILIAPASVIHMVGIVVFEDVTPTALNTLLSVIACSTKARNLLRGLLSKSKDRKRQCSVIFLMTVTEYTKHEAFNC